METNQNTEGAYLNARGEQTDFHLCLSPVAPALTPCIGPSSLAEPEPRINTSEPRTNTSACSHWGQWTSVFLGSHVGKGHDGVQHNPYGSIMSLFLEPRVGLRGADVVVLGSGIRARLCWSHCGVVQLNPCCALTWRGGWIYGIMLSIFQAVQKVQEI